MIRPHRITFSLIAALCLFIGTQAHSENLNEILNQISSDLEKKQESGATNSTSIQGHEKATQNATREDAASGTQMRPTSPQAYSGRVAFLDMNEIFTSFYKTKRAEEQLNSERAEAKKELDARLDRLKKAMDEINVLNAEIEKRASSAQTRETARIRDQKVEAARTLDSQITEFRGSREKGLQDTFVALRKSIIEDIMVVVNRKITDAGYDLVFDKSGMSMRQTPIVLYSPSSLDFSKETIGALNNSPTGGIRKNHATDAGLRLASVNLDKIIDKNRQLRNLIDKAAQQNGKKDNSEEELSAAKKRFMENLNPKLAAICARRGADVVFDSSGLSMGQICLLVNSDGLADLTEDLVTARAANP